MCTCMHMSISFLPSLQSYCKSLCFTQASPAVMKQGKGKGTHWVDCERLAQPGCDPASGVCMVGKTDVNPALGRSLLQTPKGRVPRGLTVACLLGCFRATTALKTVSDYYLWILLRKKTLFMLTRWLSSLPISSHCLLWQSITSSTTVSPLT